MNFFVDRIIFLSLLFVLTLATGLTAKLFNKNTLVFEIIITTSCGLLLGTGLFLAVPEGISSILKGHNEYLSDTGAENLGNTIGACMGLGFCLIFAFDQTVIGYTKLHLKRTQGNNEKLIEEIMKPLHPTQKLFNSDVIVTTLGLSVHSVIDGFIVGILLASQKNSSKFFGVLSMIVHKFPISFGLAAYMVSKKVSQFTLILLLSLFSISTPLSALITTSIIYQKASSPEYHTAIGRLLMVSSGTFIYTACTHVFGEAFSNKQRVAPSIQEVDPNIQQEALGNSEPHTVQGASSVKIGISTDTTKTDAIMDIKIHSYKVLAFGSAFAMPLIYEIFVYHTKLNPFTE